MAIQGTAAVSYGNDCVQRYDRSIRWIWDGLVAEQAVTLAPAETEQVTVASASGSVTPNEGVGS